MLLTYPSSLSQKLPSLSPYPYSYSNPNRRRRLFLPITRACRAEMSSPAPPPLPDNRVVLGCGGVSVDYLATVAAYPKPDDKIRSTSLKVEGGGNVGNALTGAARLGLQPRVISKVANDAQGRNVLEEFEKDGVDTSYMVVSEGGNSPFTYVIVDNQTKTRTCIHTPGSPPMLPDELSNSKLYSAIEGANLVYLDVRLHETAIVVAKEDLRSGKMIGIGTEREGLYCLDHAQKGTCNSVHTQTPILWHQRLVQATRRKIPILIDAERKREGLDELLNLATYVVCSAKFPQQLTEAPSVPTALVSMLLRLPNIKFLIVTLGEKGCMMLERSIEEAPEEGETDVESLAESLKQKIDQNSTSPICIASKSSLRLNADGIGAISGRLLIGTAEVIPPPEIVDTTGAGDAFIGAVLYALCAGMPPERMLPFASTVAATNCRALGARSGLPRRTDPRLAPFW